LLLYLDQNYLSGIVKRKPAFRELEAELHAAVRRGAVRVPEAEAHRVESEPRPDLQVLDLLRALSGGFRLEGAEPGIERRLRATMARHFPDRVERTSDVVDLSALALALPRCTLVTCDAFMGDVIRRAGLDVLYRCELYTGRRPDVVRLTAKVATLPGFRS
jgi:hypothetical protein